MHTHKLRGSSAEHPLDVGELYASSEPFAIDEIPDDQEAFWITFDAGGGLQLTSQLPAGSDRRQAEGNGDLVMTFYRGAPGALELIGQPGQDEVIIPPGAIYLSLNPIKDGSRRFRLYALALA